MRELAGSPAGQLEIQDEWTRRLVPSCCKGCWAGAGRECEEEGRTERRQGEATGWQKAVKIATFLLRLLSFQNDIIYSGTLLVEYIRH